MAWYNSLNDLRGDVGKIASNPIVDIGIGALGGPWAGAIAGGLGKAITPGANIGDIAKSTGEGAIAGYGGSKLGDIVRAGIKGGLGSALSTGIKDVTSIPGDIAGAASGGLNGLKTLAGKAGSALGLTPGAGGPGGAGGTSGNGFDWQGLLNKTLLGGGILDAAKTRQQQQDLQNKGLNYVTDAYGAKAPLRARSLSMLENGAGPDLSSIFANPANPYSKKVPPVQIGPAAPVPSPSTPGGTY